MSVTSVEYARDEVTILVEVYSYYFNIDTVVLMVCMPDDSSSIHSVSRCWPLGLCFNFKTSPAPF